MAKLLTLKPRISTLDQLKVKTFTDTERIRGTTLQNIRKAHFAKHPLCVACLAATPPRTRIATELDHITPLHMGGQEIASNRQALCTQCHNEKTITERGALPQYKNQGGR